MSPKFNMKVLSIVSVLFVVISTINCKFSADDKDLFEIKSLEGLWYFLNASDVSQCHFMSMKHEGDGYKMFNDSCEHASPNADSFYGEMKQLKTYSGEFNFTGRNNETYIFFVADVSDNKMATIFKLSNASDYYDKTIDKSNDVIIAVRSKQDYEMFTRALPTSVVYHENKNDTKPSSANVAGCALWLFVVSFVLKMFM